MLAHRRRPIEGISVPVAAFAELGVPWRIAGLSCNRVAVRPRGPIEIRVCGTAVPFELDPDVPEQLLRCLVEELPITAPM